MSRTSSEFDVDAVVSAIRRECGETVEEVNKAISEAGKAAQDYLLENSPVDTSKNAKLHMATVTENGRKVKKLKGSSGAYRKGWRIKTYTENGVKAVKVYNETCYQLTHLLEFGHLAKNGKFVQPVPHIKQAEELAERVLEDKLQ